MVQPALAVHEIRGVMGNLVADDAFRERKRVRAAHLDDAAFVHGDGEAAGIGAVQSADCVALDGRHGWLRAGGVRWRAIPPSAGGVEFSLLAKNRAIDFTAVFRFIPKKYIFK